MENEIIQWEYYRKFLNHYNDPVDRELAAFGNNGYELAAVVSGENGAWYIFKRPKKMTNGE